MAIRKLLLSTAVMLLHLSLQCLAATCRCIPGDACWPSPATWAAFNGSIGGKLVATTPLAAPCYNGSLFDPAQCAVVEANWDSSLFRADSPVGYAYPDFETCDIPGGNTTTCGLGSNPVYAVNATEPSDVAAAVAFASQNKVRLTIKTTGMDLMGRSTGAGSLLVWLRYVRQGLSAETPYQPAGVCEGALWGGEAMYVGGGYSWADVYAAAATAGLVVAGSANGDVAALGGFLQGGGYGPVTGLAGLGADQLLEAQVVTADGSTVVASACQNGDLFQALRGGGGGTYGVVTAAKLKAYADVPVASVVLTMEPVAAGGDMSSFLSGVAYLYQYFPFFAGAGLGGYAVWSLYGSNSFLEDAGPGLYLSLVAIGQNQSAVEALFAPVSAGLAQISNVNWTAWYAPYPSTSAWHYAAGDAISAVGTGGAVTSRLLTPTHLASANVGPLTYALNMSAGQPDEQTSCLAALVGGPALELAPDALSGVNPAWRQASVLHVVSRSWPDAATYADVQAIRHDITTVKGSALQALAPDTGAYMNEADTQDPNYLPSFYGNMLPILQAAKAKYDADGLFYCPTCVGADQWTADDAGRLCSQS